MWKKPRKPKEQQLKSKLLWIESMEIKGFNTINIFGWSKVSFKGMTIYI